MNDPFVFFKFVRAATAIWVRLIGRKWLMRLLGASTVVAVFLVLKDSI